MINKKQINLINFLLDLNIFIYYFAFAYRFIHLIDIYLIKSIYINSKFKKPIFSEYIIYLLLHEPFEIFGKITDTFFDSQFQSFFIV